MCKLVGIFSLKLTANTTIVSFGEGLFLGDMLVFRGICFKDCCIWKHDLKSSTFTKCVVG